MAIVFYSGNKVTGLSTDAKPTFVAVNAIFYETNTKKTYDFTGGSWVERASGLQLTDNVTINSSTASLESWLEHGVVVPDPATGLTATADGTTTTTLSYTLTGADGVTSSAVEKAEVTIAESTVTFNDEFTSDKGWTHNNSSTSVNTVNGYMNFTDPSSTHVYAVKDLQDSDALGSGNYPTTSFVVRAEVEKTSDPANAGNGSQVEICLTDSLASGWGNNQDQIGIFWNVDHTSSDGEFRAFGADNTNTYSSWSNATSLTWNSGTWYIEIIRNGTTDVTVKIFPDNTYTTPTATATHSISGMTIDTLKYLQVRIFSDSGRATTTYRIKNMSFHDGVTTVSNDSETVGSYSSAGSTSNTATYQVTGLTTDTDYKFKITPSNFIGAGSSTTSGTVNTWKIPTVPTNLTLTQYLQTGITATWTASTSETPTPVTAITYTLERSNDGSSGWTAYSGLTSSPYNDTNATADVVQYYRIKSTNSAGSSSYSSNVSFTYSPFNSPQFIADGTTTRIFGDPIMRGSPTTGGQYISDTRFQGITISTVKLWLGKNGTGGNATITCRINGTTLGTIHTSAINGSGTYSQTEVTFTGSAITTPNSAYHIDFVMSGYSGSPPSDYCMFGHRTGDVFSGGYATQSGSQTGTGKDLCMRVYFT